MNIVMFCLISTILLIFVVFEINGQSEYAESKAQNNYNITSKVNKIAKDIMSHSSANNREFVIRSVEKKLFKAAEHLGENGKKHVRLIMEGIKEKILNITKQDKKSESKNEKEPEVDKTAVDGNGSAEGTQKANNLSNTIENLINTELNNLKSAESKQKLLGNIKRRFLDSINEKLNVVPEIQETDDIMQVVNVGNNDKQEIENYFENDNKMSSTDFNDNYYVTKNTLKSFTVAHECSNAYDRVCSEIEDMNSLKCIYSDDFISLDKLCDDNNDCLHGSDEKYCGSQVMERMDFSLKVINTVDNLNEHNCFNVDKLAQHTHILRDALKTQLDFKEQYLNFSLHMNKFAEKKEVDNEGIINRKANEIAVIISSLALALYTTLCSERFDDISVPLRRSSSDHQKDVIDEMLEKITWPPKCSCIREHCPNCADTCKRICRHKHHLPNWKCESINGSSVISLNSLCDGRLDCMDESDEHGCDTALGYAKFDAYGVYSTVLKMLNLKAAKERSSTRKKLLHLRNLVIELQKLTTESKPDKVVVRKFRNQCFSLLPVIYNDILEQSSDSGEIEEAYMFLASINRNLGLALKRSHTGNNKETSDSCFCRNGTCAVPFCSKVCNKACAAEPKLMAYACKVSNANVSFDKICNDKIDCEDGYDEHNCKKGEICRRNHLLLLKRALFDAGQHLKGTSLGELINSWKTKAISMIKIAENDSRPKPKIFRNTIKDVLRALVVTYGSVEYYRRNSKDYGLTEFQKIAQIVMETVKMCGK